MTRSAYGWGYGQGLAFTHYTHLPKIGSTPEIRRALRRHKPLKCAAEVFARDRYTCRKCGYCEPRGIWGLPVWVEHLTVDHVIPASCGGSDEPHNLTTLCRRCNTRRGAYYPAPRVLL